MSEYQIPELPSDEELGITGLSLEDPDPGESGGKAKKLMGSGKPPTPPPPGKLAAEPRRPYHGLLTLLGLLSLTFAVSSQRMRPSPAPANAPDTAFSSARAMVELVEIAELPRPLGSPAHARARAHLLARMEGLGLGPEVQTTTSLLRVGDGVRSATVRNLVGRMPVTATTGALLLTAHYDSRGISP